ncbi:MAG TPA: hypothetical protein VNN08_23775 [Thermoanaerobaculia bacterium]|nr:hypothetical protein [Thermoanaerobaculia bacterium]
MKRSSLLGLLLVAVACAHAPQGSPVRVTVNASNGARGLVDTAALQRITEAEIRGADGAVRQPLSLAVSFDSYGFVECPDGRLVPIALGRSTPGPTVSATRLPYLSATPWDDGLIVEPPSKAILGHFRREVVIGSYTISDNAGNVREQRRVVVGAPDPQASAMVLELASMKTTGHYLAERVAALSQ